tara:strand:- start:532 stop:705 length:174 start_codon:yes stop_codon:yes gene_type:complete
MIFKGRGVTIGDLTILFIVILLSFFLINKSKEPKTQKQISNIYRLEMQKNNSESLFL